MSIDVIVQFPEAAYMKVGVPVSGTSGRFSFRFTVDLCGLLAPIEILDGMVVDVQNQKPEGELVMLTGVIQI